MKKLVLITACFALLLFGGGLIYKKFHSQSALTLQKGNPVIGLPRAPIGMILIEDFHCGACRHFSSNLFPQIQARYLDTGKAYCIFVPVAFLQGSEALGNAALAVYHLAPQQFLPYIHELFTQNAEKGDLLSIAEQLGGIDLNQLQTCIETDCFSQQLKENLAWARQQMGDTFGTPALFVNGVRTPTNSLDAIEKAVRP